jgi:hypothetical protein
MATYSIPSNSGKFIVVVAGGGHYAVWNRKHDKNEISIPVKTKKQAREICEKLNKKQHDGTISV